MTLFRDLLVKKMFHVCILETHISINDITYTYNFWARNDESLQMKKWNFSFPFLPNRHS